MILYQFFVAAANENASARLGRLRYGHGALGTVGVAMSLRNGVRAAWPRHRQMGADARWNRSVHNVADSCVPIPFKAVLPADLIAVRRDDTRTRM